MPAAFMAQCTMATKKTSSFCECSLKAFSKSMRETRKRDLSVLEMNYASERAAFLSDPAMSDDKIDAVCDLHDSALEYKNQAAIARKTDAQKYRDLRAKSFAQLDRKKELAEGYNAGHQVAGSLIAGKFCDNRHKISEIKRHQAEDETMLYGEIRELFEMNPNFYSSAIFREGQKGKCS